MKTLPQIVSDVDNESPPLIPPSPPTTLPNNLGMEEFTNTPVEGFGSMILSKYGWHKGEGIGKKHRNKGDIKGVEFRKRPGTAGLGYPAVSSRWNKDDPKPEIAESSKVHADDKEAEVRLLGSSVEELESTVHVLENKVGVIKGEAEKQLVQREKLEIELERQLQERLSVLQKEVAYKEAKIDQFKVKVSKLNMHADAQAREYQQKFKELEAMTQQVRTEPAHSSATSMKMTKAEKGATKSRGTGSPFKCIGLGLTQQIKSEKVEELTTARRQIDELQDLAVRRQKEIFMLNARLAATESMAHDTILDLLRIKLDMTNYAENKVSRLKEQLHQFNKERQRCLDEISQKHTEMVASQFMSEKSRQQILTEYEILKADNSKYKEIIMELDDKVKELSYHQNLQNRIHHHAKAKEGNFLRLQNEELNEKLERSEVILSHVKEKLARYRDSSGQRPYVYIDEEVHLRNRLEKHLRKRLEDSEVKRAKLAEKLLHLCRGILKVAGLSYNSSNIIPLEAKDVLVQLKDPINALESELQDLKLQRKLSCEKI